MRVLTPVMLVCSILPSCSGYSAQYREVEIPEITAGDLWDEVLRFTANRYTRGDAVIGAEQHHDAARAVEPNDFAANDP